MQCLSRHPDRCCAVDMACSIRMTEGRVMEGSSMKVTLFSFVPMGHLGALTYPVGEWVECYVSASLQKRNIRSLEASH